MSLNSGYVRSQDENHMNVKKSKHRMIAKRRKKRMRSKLMRKSENKKFSMNGWEW